MLAGSDSFGHISEAITYANDIFDLGRIPLIIGGEDDSI